MAGPNTENMPGKGVLNLSFRMPSLPYTMCGWVYKMSGGMFNKEFKRRWVTLVDYQLSYFESPSKMNDIKGTINCREITAIDNDDVKGTKCIKLTAGKEIWQIYWDPNEPVELQRMWNRKLRRCCIRIPDLELQKIAPRLQRTNPTNGQAPIYRKPKPQKKV